MNRRDRRDGDIVAATEGSDPFILRGWISLEDALGALCVEGYLDSTERPDPLHWRIRHASSRCVPAQPGEDYRYWIHPAKEGQRGAFRTTEVWYKP